jgi:hypothetical protein
MFIKATVDGRLRQCKLFYGQHLLKSLSSLEKIYSFFGEGRQAGSGAMSAACLLACWLAASRIILKLTSKHGNNYSIIRPLILSFSVGSSRVGLSSDIIALWVTQG